MTKRHPGRQWHCRTCRTIQLDYASPPQAMQWPDGRSKHIRRWLGCGNSIPRYVFPISKTRWALGVPKTSRDTKKDCGKPDCPNDHHGQVLARGDEDRMTSANGTKRTCRSGRWMSASLIGRLGSSAFRLSTTTVSMSLAGSCFSSESAPRPFHHG